MKRLTALLSFIVVLAFASTAPAIVTQWDYSLSAIFTNSLLTNGAPLPDGTILAWGTSTGSGQSRLVIDPSAVAGTVDTYTGGGVIPSTYWADSVALTHENKPITGESLSTTTLVVSVLLDPFVPNNPALPGMQFSFPIDFTETPNVGAPAEYDVFALLAGFPNFNFAYDAGDGDGLRQYFVNVFPSTGGVLSGLTEPHASLAGVPVGTLGFVTPEGQDTTLGFSFTISTQPFNVVPEPSTIVLLGAGLIGLGVFGRKKFRKN